MEATVLRVENLTKRYGELTAVDNLTLEVRKGEVLGLLGPNGAGKTTTINMMVGLLKPDAGKVYLHGELVSGSDRSARHRVGVCPQEIIIWGRLTCIEQLKFIGEMYGLPGSEARRRGDALLETLELVEKRNKLASTLSGGMQRRLNLAMSLVHDPEIVVLDEPGAGLDPQSRVLVREFIKQLAQQKTVILTTHNMDEADRLADRVAIIDHGKLLVVETSEVLKAEVGPGDVAEINLGDQLVDVEMIRQLLSDIEGEVVIENAEGLLLVRALKMVHLLPELIERFESANLKIQELRLRENTLEDVFLQLTGRRLRE